MKQIITTFILLLSFSASIFAQKVPQGMKYQAVARDAQGQVISDKNISLKITLNNDAPDGKVAYSEIHQVKTNMVGLFNLVIGQGESTNGDFAEVPWASFEIWMNLSMDEEGEGNFLPLGANQLLAVPYAMHSGTAGNLVDENGVEKNSIWWNVTGNVNANPLYTFIGTRDNNDLVFKTNNLERMRIGADGTIDIAGDLSVGNNALIGNDLQVNNNANIGNDLNVDGLGTFNNLTVKNTVILNSEGSTTTINGAANLESTLDVDGATDLNSSLTVDGATDLNSTLNVDGTTTSGGKLTVNDISALNGQVTINASITGGLQEDYSQYPLQVEGGDYGVAIKINDITPDRNANFLTLFDGAGNPMGRIEGFRGIQGAAQSIAASIVNDMSESAAFGFSTNKNQSPSSVPSSATQFFNSDYGFGILSGSLDFVLAIVKFAVNLAGASGLCVSGDCDDVIWSAVDIVVSGIQLGGFIAYNEFNVGAAFESGGADYAEWLQKADSQESLNFGDVVGIKGGYISKTYRDAEKFMVISNNPTVIGAMPQDGAEVLYEKVAFMGQVPVKVIGEVKVGDYILPSGNGDGMAIAVSADEMNAKDYGRIIGTAWGESDGKQLFQYVNTAVGINTNDLANVVDQMQSVLNQMQESLNRLDPEYQAFYYDVDSNAGSMANSYTQAPTLTQIAGSNMDLSSYSNLQEGLQQVLSYSKNQNLDLSQYPYILDLMQDPTNPELLQQTLDHYQSAITRIQNMINEIQGD